MKIKFSWLFSDFSTTKIAGQCSQQYSTKLYFLKTLLFLPAKRALIVFISFNNTLDGKTLTRNPAKIIALPSA